jgi:hypothetical protein
LLEILLNAGDCQPNLSRTTGSKAQRDIPIYEVRSHIVFVLTVGMFQAMLPADVLRMDRLRGLGTTTRISFSDSINVAEI